MLPQGLENHSKTTKLMHGAKVRLQCCGHLALIIHMKKLLDSDWLRKECKMCNTSAKKFNTSAKSVIQCKLHIEILDYDWLINNRV